MPHDPLHPARQELDRLFAEAYAELERIARTHFPVLRRDQITPDTQALVSEAYLRLANLDRIPWHTAETDRKRLARGLAHHAMKQFLLQYRRAANAEKRGSGITPLSLDDDEVSRFLSLPQKLDLETLLTFQLALDELEEKAPGATELVEAKMFGTKLNAIAERRNVHRNTISRQWLYAKRFLLKRLE